MKKNNTISIHWVDYLFIFLIIFISTETILFGTNSNLTFVSMRKIFTLLLFPLVYIKHQFVNPHVAPMGRMDMGFVLGGILLLSSFLNGEFGPQAMMRALLIFSGFLYVRYTSLKTFSIAFEKIIFIIAIFSILVEVISFVAPFFLSLVPEIENTGGVSYYNLLLATIHKGWEGLVRLQGPFREPGVAIIYFFYAFVFHILNEDKVNYLRIIVYFAAIVFSFSTTGYISLVFILLLLIVKYRRNGFKKSYIYLVVLLSIAIISLSVYTDFLSSEGLVFSKVSNEEHSFLARQYSFLTNWEIIKTAPLLGVGNEQTSSMFSSINYRLEGYTISDNTNLYMIYMATYGIVYGLLCTFGLFLFDYKLTNTKKQRYLVCVPLLLLFAGEAMFENILIFILIAYGFNMKYHQNELS